MGNSIPVKSYGNEKVAHTGLAVQIKKMLNDIIDVAFQESVSSKRLGQYKRFTIFCTEAQMNSKLGDCWYNKDGSASIRILGLNRDRYQDSLITAIHEVAHHVDHSNRGRSGHDSEFYRIHKILLFAAFDMGILTVDDVIHSESNARNRDKLAKMMKDYVPHPVDYKKDIVQVFVYNSYAVKNTLKANGYRWNGLECAWSKEILKNELEKEIDFLFRLRLVESDIKVIESHAVVTRIRKSAKLFHVPRECNHIVKEFGYRWTDAGKLKYWKKKIDGDSLPESERKELEKIEGIYIVVD